MFSAATPHRTESCDIQTPIWKSPAVCLAAGLFILRLLHLPWPDLFPEEAYYWNYAQHLDFGYLDHPPMVAWLIASGTHVFGQNEFGVRVAALVCSLLTSFFAYRLANLLYGCRAGPVAALLTQVLPFFFIAGWMMTPDAPLSACWAGALYFFARAFLARERGAWLGVGVWMGLGLLSKYTMALLGPAALAFLLVDPPSRGWLRRHHPYLAALLALAIFLPVVVWNMTHHWASFTFQSTGRLRQQTHFALPELLGSILLMLTPIGIALAWRAWRWKHAGTAEVLADEKRRWRFVWAFTLAPLAVFVLFSLSHRVKLNWTGPLWLALVPAIAAQLVSEGGAQSMERTLRLGCRFTAGILAVLYIGLLQYLTFGLPCVPDAKNIVLLPVGWPQLGQELARQQADVRQRTGGRVLIVGMDHDFIASEAAFYHPQRAGAVAGVTGAHLFGEVSLMYSYWFPPAAQDGASLVLASFNSHWLDSEDVRAHCGALEPVQTHAIRRNGRTVCEYFTRVARDYRSGGYPLEPVQQEQTGGAPPDVQTR